MVEDPGGLEHEGRNEHPAAIKFEVAVIAYCVPPEVGVDATEIDIPGGILTASVEHDSVDWVHESNKIVVESVWSAVDEPLIFEKFCPAVGLTGLGIKSFISGYTDPDISKDVHAE